MIDNIKYTFHSIWSFLFAMITYKIMKDYICLHYQILYLVSLKTNRHLAFEGDTKCRFLVNLFGLIYEWLDKCYQVQFTPTLSSNKFKLRWVSSGEKNPKRHCGSCIQNPQTSNIQFPSTFGVGSASIVHLIDSS